MTRLLAEYKRSSPWAGKITDRGLPDVVSEYDANPDVFGISIVADPEWGGRGMEDIQLARALTCKPILAKFGPNASTGTKYLAIRAGASWYLTYDWVEAADDPVHAWLELHEPEVPPELPLVVVCNNRDIRTGLLRPDAALDLAARLPRRGTMICAASGYKGIHAVPGIFDFGLIGTHFLTEGLCCI